MGRLWQRLDLNAGLTAVGLTVTPLDIRKLSAVEYDLLPEWADDWTERRKAAQKAAEEAAKSG